MGADILFKIDDNGVLIVNAVIAMKWNLSTETFSRITQKLKAALANPRAAAHSWAAKGFQPA